MKEELADFVLNNELSPFSSGKTLLKSGKDSIYKTRDAKAVHTKVLGKVSNGFVFAESSNIWNCFGFTDSVEVIKLRQKFFADLVSRDSSFLRRLEKPRASWKPQYDVVVVTEDEATFVALNDLNCGVQLLTNQNDVAELERYDIVQVVDCDDFRILLERLPQSVFVDSIEDVYLERYLEELSGWRENFVILRQAQNNKVGVSGVRGFGGSVDLVDKEEVVLVDKKEDDLGGCGLSEEIVGLLDELESCFALLENKEGKIITESEVERVLETINEGISEKVRDMTISGEGLMKMLGEGKMPSEILEIVRGAIEESGLSEHIFNLAVPVTIDYKELEDQIKRQSASEFTDLAERVKMSSDILKKVPGILKKLSALILVEDFCLGIKQWINFGKEGEMRKVYPSISENLHFSGAKNMFLSGAQAIDFQLDSFSRCSILTGANSGGKTTLLEHVLQNISLFQLGLPVSGEVHLPMFSDVYYFAKTKGSTSKGAFETLLTQMSKIRGGSVDLSDYRSLNVGVSDDLDNCENEGKVLILADEIEAVTEPGVAGRIISATAEYFVGKGCFMILATHLGAEIEKNLVDGMRVDGIEAKGLDENFDLVVDHNPVMGRLASSTPELIVERMAGSFDSDYFRFLFDRIKK